MAAVLVVLMLVCSYQTAAFCHACGTGTAYVAVPQRSLPCSDRCEPCPSSALQRQAQPECIPGLLPLPPPDLWRPSGEPTLHQPQQIQSVSS